MIRQQIWRNVFLLNFQIVKNDFSFSVRNDFILSTNVYSDFQICLLTLSWHDIFHHSIQPWNIWKSFLCLMSRVSIWHQMLSSKLFYEMNFFHLRNVSSNSTLGFFFNVVNALCLILRFVNISIPKNQKQTNPTTSGWNINTKTDANILRNKQIQIIAVQFDSIMIQSNASQLLFCNANFDTILAFHTNASWVEKSLILT